MDGGRYGWGGGHGKVMSRERGGQGRGGLGKGRTEKGQNRGRGW